MMSQNSHVTQLHSCIEVEVCAGFKTHQTPNCYACKKRTYTT